MHSCINCIWYPIRSEFFEPLVSNIKWLFGTFVNKKCKQNENKSENSVLKKLCCAIAKIIYGLLQSVYVAYVEAINEIANHLVSLCNVLLLQLGVRCTLWLLCSSLYKKCWFGDSFHSLFRHLCMCVCVSLVRHASIKYTICGICVGFVWPMVVNVCSSKNKKKMAQMVILISFLFSRWGKKARQRHRKWLIWFSMK